MAHVVTAGELLDGHSVLDVECLDRILYRFKTDRMVFDLGFMRSVTQPGSTR